MKRFGIPLLVILGIGLLVLWYENRPSGRPEVSPLLPSLRFSSLESFSEGLAGFRDGGKTGYLNRKGEVAILPRFRVARRFSEGLAGVFDGSRWGYIDTAGKVVIPLQFHDCFDFHEGFAVATVKDTKLKRKFYKIIDRTGKIVANPPLNYEFFSEVSEGLISFAKRVPFPIPRPPLGPGLMPPPSFFSSNPFNMGTYGYMNPFGKVIINPQFTASSQQLMPIGNFSEGLAFAQKNQKYGYIDKSGKFVIQPQWIHAYDFHQGKALVSTGSDHYFIDKTGKTIRKIPSEDVIWTRNSYFPEGLGVIHAKGKVGFCDPMGKVIIEPRFDSVRLFSEGLAVVEVGSTIRKEINWRYIQGFWEDLCCSDHLISTYPVHGKFGYIDKAGRMVILPMFDSAEDFHEGFARVEVFGQYHFIDKTGRPLECASSCGGKPFNIQEKERPSAAAQNAKKEGG